MAWRDDKELRAKYHKQYHQKNRETHLAAMKQYRELPSSKNIKREYDRKRRQEFRLKVLMHYSVGTLVCCRCGFGDTRALSIDHINGGGCAHLKIIGQSHLYGWLIRNKFPAGFQTLCMNCQWIKRRENREEPQPIEYNSSN